MTTQGPVSTPTTPVPIRKFPLWSAQIRTNVHEAFYDQTLQCLLVTWNYCTSLSTWRPFILLLFFPHHSPTTTHTGSVAAESAPQVQSLRAALSRLQSFPSVISVPDISLPGERSLVTWSVPPSGMSGHECPSPQHKDPYTTNHAISWDELLRTHPMKTFTITLFTMLLKITGFVTHFHL